MKMKFVCLIDHTCTGVRSFNGLCPRDKSEWILSIILRKFASTIGSIVYVIYIQPIFFVHCCMKGCRLENSSSDHLMTAKKFVVFSVYQNLRVHL